MRSANESLYNPTRRTVSIYLAILLGIAVILGVLHFFLADLRVEGIRWFNLDKERNIPTWFTGGLPFLFGCSAVVAFYSEQRINSQGKAVFRLPILWLGVGLAGMLMSLDEITILHENIFWRETRQTTTELSDAFVYVTQWQVLFAPAILLMLGYFVVFFSNRFSSSPTARRAAFAAIGFWVIALLLEGVRGTFKELGAGWYSNKVIVEEVFEVVGAILLLASVVFYTIDIALNMTDERHQKLKLASRFLTLRVVVQRFGQ